MKLRLPNTIGELSAKDRRSGGLWVKQISTYLLWFEFLAISPSYELARRYRAGEALEANQLPSDFDRVLGVFDDLGDVQKALFRLWWKDVGLAQFGFQGSPPSVSRVSYAPHAAAVPSNLVTDVERYFQEDWVAEGHQRTLLLAIPVGLPESKINKQIKKQLARIKPDRRQLIKTPAKYPLVGKRHHKDALIRYLRMAWLRSAMYRDPLWRVGAQAKVSETYSPILSSSEDEEVVTYTADRDIMTIIASRALLRARLISENAARGVFPSHQNCDGALAFDFKELRQRINRRTKWQEKEILRLKRLHGSDD